MTTPSPKSRYWGSFRSVGLGCVGQVNPTRPARARDYLGFSLWVGLTSLVLTKANTVAVVLDDTWYWGLHLSFTVLLSSAIVRVPSLVSVRLFFRPPMIVARSSRRQGCTFASVSCS